MLVFLDGATGYLGGAIATALVAGGHEVRAHARSAEAADALAADGVTPVVGELTDASWLEAQLADVDGAIHTASPGDATSGSFDTAVVAAVVAAFAGTDRPYVHTGGSWVHGSGDRITEDTPYDPPAVVAWRPAIVDRVRAAASDGVRTTVIAPANVYGHGGGLLNVILHGPTDDDALAYPGERQRFANVFLDDLAALYVLALTTAPADSYYLAANPSVRMDEIAVAASRIRGLDGRVRPEAPDAARDRLGPLADAFLLDAEVDATRARELGWRPNGPGLLDELASGSYAGAAS